MMQAHHTMHPLQIIRGSAKYIALLGTVIYTLLQCSHG